MIQAALIALLTFAATVAQASVWDELEHKGSAFKQMQDGETSPVEGKIADVNPRQGAIYLTVNTNNELGEEVTKTVKVCAANNEYYKTEAERAVVLSQQLQNFKAAKQSKEVVRLSYKGPWDPCVTPASL